MSFSEENPDLANLDLSTVCRACMSTTGVIKDMFVWGLAMDYYKLTNVSLQPSDTISKSICVGCEDMLTKCIQFKRQCEKSDFLLNDTAKKKLTSLTEEVILFPKETVDNEIKFRFDENKITYMITAPNMEEKLMYPCPYSCNETFQKQSLLSMHFVKSHNKNHDFAVEIRFYCSHADCVYHIENNKYFSKRKQLNQHFSKVHKDKIVCGHCNLKFSKDIDYKHHLKSCNYLHWCQVCDKKYVSDERLMVHLMRNHPEFHKRYKRDKAEKRKSEAQSLQKKAKKAEEEDLILKRSSATQTLEKIKNNVLLSWQSDSETKTDEISTQTVFDESFKSQTSEDESLCGSLTLSEFGLSKVRDRNESPDLSTKKTQTCDCLYDSTSRVHEKASNECISTETQTLDLDDFSNFNSAETQTSFEEDNMCNFFIPDCNPECKKPS
ncbi:unnamed protein product [Pieris macdunnoughi]|uniref:C2H2-type domain-containing protein n=1 Tax=Pieris macdunnoughi TaxID=345717 RepID=A0A821XGY4_9NEOP|nr:unnamed protein product [Pieris macdunnoughi]